VIEGYLFEVEAFIRSGWNAPLFTGKLVKSLLIDANPRLKPLFQKISGAEPKLIHITPLYRNDNGKITCVYSRVVKSNQSRRTERKEEKEKINVGKVRVNGRYKFYIGFIEAEGIGWFDSIYNTVLNVSGRHVFSNHLFEVDLVSLKTIDVNQYATSFIQDILKQGEKTEGKARRKIKIVFSSPTLLRDPFRSAKHKSLIPTPTCVFSTPIYTYLYLTGRLTLRNFYNLTVFTHRVFNEAHTIYDTTRRVWVLYEQGKNPIPAIAGYVNYHLNQTYYEKYKARFDITTFLEEIFKIMTALGTGTSRATGFGHILLRISEAIEKD